MLCKMQQQQGSLGRPTSGKAVTPIEPRCGVCMPGSPGTLHARSAHTARASGQFGARKPPGCEWGQQQQQLVESCRLRKQAELLTSMQYGLVW